MTRRPAPFRRPRLARRLAAAPDGAAVVEFAIVAPVFLILLLGIFDIGQMVYAKAILSGAVEKAARSGSLEAADTAAADEAVKAAILPILPQATVTTSRRSYFDFTDVARPEKWTDTNLNGTCDDGEPYVDENRSGQWEQDVGKAGNGGAGDVVLYTVTVTYKPLFTAKFFSDYNADRTLSAVGVRKNQPFANQTAYGSSAGSCM
ncbi:MAG: TadE family protein [Novosphingobium sp.]